jgi:hypothetical protein
LTVYARLLTLIDMGFFDALFVRKPTPDAFGSLFVEAARRRGFDETLSYNADEFRLEYADSAVFNLHHAYRAYCSSDRASREAALRGFVATLCSSRKAAPEHLANARTMLRPLIRGRGVLEDVRLHQLRTAGREALFAPAWRAFGDDCATLLALDYPESTSTLMSGPAESWGISLDDALAIACDNLRDITTDAFVEVARGVYRGDWRDGYDASRALLPDLLHRAPVRGFPVFMIPTRDVLLVTSDKDDGGLARMVELSHEAAQTGRPVSPFMYCHHEGLRRFTPRQPEVTQRLAQLALRYRKDDYDAQKVALDRLHEQEGNDVFVANYLLYGARDDAGEMFSAATWTAGVESLLPEADRIVLVRPESGETRIVPWQQIAPLVGVLLEEEPMYPVRYRTHGFPDVSRFAAIESGAT